MYSGIITQLSIRLFIGSCLCLPANIIPGYEMSDKYDLAFLQWISTIPIKQIAFIQSKHKTIVLMIYWKTSKVILKFCSHSNFTWLGFNSLCLAQSAIEESSLDRIKMTEWIWPKFVNMTEKFTTTNTNIWTWPKKYYINSVKFNG